MNCYFLMTWREIQKKMQVLYFLTCILFSLGRFENKRKYSKFWLKEQSSTLVNEEEQNPHLKLYEYLLHTS